MLVVLITCAQASTFDTLPHPKQRWARGLVERKLPGGGLAVQGDLGAGWWRGGPSKLGARGALRAGRAKAPFHRGALGAGWQGRPGGGSVTPGRPGGGLGRAPLPLNITYYLFGGCFSYTPIGEMFPVVQTRIDDGPGPWAALALEWALRKIPTANLLTSTLPRSMRI